MQDQPTIPAAAKDDLPRLFLIAAVLPAVIAGVNYALWDRIAHKQGTTLETCVQFGWAVMQVGLGGYAVGRGIGYPWLRWVVLGWNLLLINGLAALLSLEPSFGRRPEHSMPSAALIAGQMGLCVVWGAFGDTRWVLRWPAIIVAGAALYCLWIGFGNSGPQQMWTELLVLQVLTLGALCGILRWLGFRLLPQSAEGQQPAPRDGQRPLQFGIKHVLLWTTALAIVLGLAKAMDLLTWRTAQEIVRGGIFWKVVVATSSAVGTVVALWVALGRGHWALRYPVGLAFVLFNGGVLSAWSRANAASINRVIILGWMRVSQSQLELLRWYEIGWWWLAWMFLSGGLLAATLIILRTRGYRLVRIVTTGGRRSEVRVQRAGY